MNEKSQLKVLQKGLFCVVVHIKYPFYLKAITEIGVLTNHTSLCDSLKLCKKSLSIFSQSEFLSACE